MAENSKIEWTTHTFNPWRGCSRVSEGCRFCYAETLSHRNPKVLGVWGDKGTRVVAAEPAWREPLKWDRAAAAAGERHRVFCASLADVFEARPELVEPRLRLFKLIGQTPHLDWLLLTKRPEVAIENWMLWVGYWCAVQKEQALIQRVYETRVLPNVWLGVSVENNDNRWRIEQLLRIPARVHFVSYEPALGPLDVSEHMGCFHSSDDPNQDDHSECAPRLSWVIAGGESGHGHRPLEADWVRDLRDRCGQAGVAFFFKQWGGRRSKSGGRELDGEIWDDMPARVAAAA